MTIMKTITTLMIKYTNLRAFCVPSIKQQQYRKNDKHYTDL